MACWTLPHPISATYTRTWHPDRTQCRYMGNLITMTSEPRLRQELIFLTLYLGNSVLKWTLTTIQTVFQEMTGLMISWILLTCKAARLSTLQSIWRTTKSLLFRGQ